MHQSSKHLIVPNRPYSYLLRLAAMQQAAEACSNLARHAIFSPTEPIIQGVTQSHPRNHFEPSEQSSSDSDSEFVNNLPPKSKRLSFDDDLDYYPSVAVGNNRSERCGAQHPKDLLRRLRHQPRTEHSKAKCRSRKNAHRDNKTRMRISGVEPEHNLAPTHNHHAALPPGNEILPPRDVDDFIENEQAVVEHDNQDRNAQHHGMNFGYLSDRFSPLYSAEESVIVAYPSSPDINDFELVIAPSFGQIDPNWFRLPRGWEAFLDFHQSAALSDQLIPEALAVRCMSHAELCVRREHLEHNINGQSQNMRFVFAGTPLVARHIEVLLRHMQAYAFPDMHWLIFDCDGITNAIVYPTSYCRACNQSFAALCLDVLKAARLAGVILVGIEANPGPIKDAIHRKPRPKGKAKFVRQSKPIGHKTITVLPSEQEEMNLMLGDILDGDEHLCRSWFTDGCNRVVCKYHHPANFEQLTNYYRSEWGMYDATKRRMGLDATEIVSDNKVLPRPGAIVPHDTILLDEKAPVHEDVKDSLKRMHEAVDKVEEIGRTTFPSLDAHIDASPTPPLSEVVMPVDTGEIAIDVDPKDHELYNTARVYAAKLVAAASPMADCKTITANVANVLATNKNATPHTVSQAPIIAAAEMHRGFSARDSVQRLRSTWADTRSTPLSMYFLPEYTVEERHALEQTGTIYAAPHPTEANKRVVQYLFILLFPTVLYFISTNVSLLLPFVHPFLTAFSAGVIYTLSAYAGRRFVGITPTVLETAVCIPLFLLPYYYTIPVIVLITWSAIRGPTSNNFKL